ncbi:MAG: hypothetical protein WCT99_05615 [Bacteroidota bacterium]|jgi:hypothetical protein
MIALIVFYLHIVGFAYGFTKEYQQEGLSAGFLNLGFMVLIFSVGWSISTFLLRYVMGEPGFGVWLDRSTFSLVLLTLGEILFYYNYYSDGPKKQ